MKERGIFYYWGPLLFRVKLATKDVQALKKLGAEAKLKKIHVGKTLAGVIKKEFQINIKKYNEIIQPYFKVYFEAYKKWYDNEIKKLDVISAWINYMEPGEFNPPHTHNRCHLSSVLYLDIPPGLKEEQKKFKGNGIGPGGIDFFIAGPQPFSNNSYTFTPDVGDFFIFPWSLTHYVRSFTCPGTRVSIAANFKIDTKNKGKLFNV